MLGRYAKAELLVPMAVFLWSKGSSSTDGRDIPKRPTPLLPTGEPREVLLLYPVDLGELPAHVEPAGGGLG